MSFSRRDILLGSGLFAGALACGSVSAASAPAPVSPPLVPEDWASVRAQFRLSPEYVHLANFYLASNPASVRAALERYRDALDDNPYNYLDDHMFAGVEQAIWPKVCAAAAAYVGGQPEEIALTSSTTVGLALIYNGLRLEPGSEVLTTTHDFFPHHEAIRLACAKSGASLRKVSLYQDPASVSVDEIVSRIREALRPATRVLGITWVHSGTGVRLPIREISAAVSEVNQRRESRDRILIVVDGVHGFGVVDEDVAAMGCDFFSAGTHKWILGPHGTGIVWGKAESWPLVQPTIPSLMSGETIEAWRKERAPSGPTRAAWVSPGGFFAFPHQWATIEAFRFHEQIGRKRIADRTAELNGRLKEGLAGMKHVTLHTPRARGLSAGINCFEVAGHAPQEVVKFLRERRVIASASPYATPYARLAAGIVNSPEDIDIALNVVQSLA